ncbi:MAG TPA: Dabb family protein [Acidobacteriaceae bacterium]
MYVHIFAFQWQPGTTEEQKAQAAEAIRAFQGSIAGLLETSVGTNLSPRGQGYTFAGLMKFTDRAAYAAYEQHPAHLALLAWLVPLIKPLELDFEA